MTHAAIDLWYICVDRNNLLVEDNPEYVRHGDVVQLIHGITSRALNRSVPVFGQCVMYVRLWYISRQVQMGVL